MNDVKGLCPTARSHASQHCKHWVALLPPLQVRRYLGLDCSVLMGANIAGDIAKEQVGVMWCDMVGSKV